MREITKEQLAEILDKHSKWLNDEDGGERADLISADLRSADLRSANLRYADLRYANLSSADLSSANLSSANLSSAVGQYYITQRTDSYQFFLVLDKNGRWYIRAGCQYMTIKQYRKHTNSYEDESKRVETNLILDFAEAKLNSAIEKKAAA